MAVIDAWFSDTFIGLLRQTIAFDIGDTTPGLFKGILCTDDMTPDYDQADPAYGTDPLDVGEASGPGYTAGGQDLTVDSFNMLDDSKHKLAWKFNGSLLWTETTIEASGILVYDPATDRAYCTRAFPGGTEDTADGDFEVVFPATGLWISVLRTAP